MSKSLTIQRIANGVICIPEGGDLTQAHAFTDVLSTSGDSAKFLGFVNTQLAVDAPPTPAEVKTELTEVSETLTNETPT